MNEIEKMCRDHFNQPVLMMDKTVRLIGYAEDEMDCYLIVKDCQLGEYWHTAVGGYIFLDKLKEQNLVVASTGENWDDFYRIDNFLELNGASKEKDFKVVKNYHQ